MSEWNCRRQANEIVECVRTGAEPGVALTGHLAECARCRETLDDQLKLTSDLRLLRDVAGRRRFARTRRDEILLDFDAVHRSRPRLLRWALAAAAVLALMLGSIRTWNNSMSRDRNSRVASVAQQAMVDLDGFSGDNSEFVAVPYAPPLATGESVSIVHTELQPAALSRLGIHVDASYTTDIPADVIVGEDGLPRAVRLVETIDF